VKSDELRAMPFFMRRLRIDGLNTELGRAAPGRTQAKLVPCDECRRLHAEFSAAVSALLSHPFGRPDELAEREVAAMRKIFFEEELRVHAETVHGFRSILS
jgi:hypothetical protein